MVFGCDAVISRGFAKLITTTGVSLGILGAALIVIGAVWDFSASSSYLYVLTTEDIYHDSFGQTVNPQVLLYPGILVIICVFPACLQMVQKVRSMTILFLLSLVISLSGSILAAALSGISWKDISLVYEPYLEGHCSVVDFYCVCIVAYSEGNRTAKLAGSNCGYISDAYHLVSAYFALSIVSTLLITGAFYIGFMVCCNPVHEKRLIEASAMPPSYGAAEPHDNTNISVTTRPPFNQPEQYTRLSVPGYAPIAPTTTTEPAGAFGYGEPNGRGDSTAAGREDKKPLLVVE